MIPDRIHPLAFARRHITVGILCLIGLTMAAYWPAVHCDYIWDDDAYVQNNQHLRSLEGLLKIWTDVNATPQYYPLVHTSYWLEYHLWKLDPRGYHTVNILLHCLSAVLLWRVLRRLKVPGAYLAAAFFVIHPVTVESVAWITERKNVLSGVFYLASALSYLRFAFGNGQTRGAKPHPTRKDDRQIKNQPPDLTSGAGTNRRMWYVLALIFFICALLSKTVTATLPAVLLVVLWWKHGRVRFGDVAKLIPFFVVGAAMGLLTVWLEKHHVGAKGTTWDLSFVERCLLAGRAMCFYVTKIVWPEPLSFFYYRWEISQADWRQYLYLVPFPAIVFIFWKLRGRFGKGPLAAVLFFGVTLFPALGFFNVYPMLYSWVADHFQYLATIGIIGLIAAGGASLVRLRSGLKIPVLVVGLSALGLCGVLTFKRCIVYQNPETLWLDTVAKNPSAWAAYNNLGRLYQKQNRMQEAAACFLKTTEIMPDHPFAYINLANVYRAEHQLDLARKTIQEAIRLHPDFGVSYFIYGLILIDEGEQEKGIGQMLKAVELEPGYSDARLALARTYYEAGHYAEAAGQLESLLQYKPYEPSTWSLLAKIYSIMHDTGKARMCFERLVELDPGNANALNALAWVYATSADPASRKPSQAVGLAEKANRLTNSQRPDILDTLAAAYAAQGDFEKATRIAQQAVSLAESLGHSSLADNIRQKLPLYQQKKMYIERHR